MTCIRNPPPLDAARAAVDYAFPWSELVTRYKFGNWTGSAHFLATLMLKVPEVRSALKELDDADHVIPMPLATERLSMRGFNQAWELAKGLSAISGTQAQADARLLLRVRHTHAQSELKREERAANVQGAFQLEPLQAHRIHGRRVVLVDDVMTTGASLHAAALALREAGARHITAIVLARTPAA